MVAAVAAGASGSVLLFEPAAPVFTLGRRAREGADRAALAATVALCAARGIDILEVDRGGLGTLHLPGQLVVFVAVPCGRAQIAALVDELLATAQRTAAALGVPSVVGAEDRIGLWHPTGKLASIGLRHAIGVARHGLALGVDLPAAASDGLLLCGLPDAHLTSVAACLGARSPLSVAALAARFAAEAGLVVMLPHGGPFPPALAPARPSPRPKR